MSSASQKPGLEKSDDSSKASNSIPNFGVIRFEVDKVSTLDKTGRFSPEIEVGGLPWIARVRRSMVYGEDSLAVHLYSMEHESTQWSIDVQSEVNFANPDNSQYTYEMFAHTFNYDNVRRLCGSLSWQDLMDEEEGFVKDDEIVVEIRFSILNMEGIWINPRSRSNRSKVLIMMNGETVQVDRKSLSYESARNVKLADDNSSGFVSFEINVSDIGIEPTYSPVIEVHGIEWSVGVRKLVHWSYLEMYLYPPTGDSNIWSVDVAAQLSLINSSLGGDETKRFKVTFSQESGQRGYNKFILWDDLINEDKGFVNDGKITIEARITLSNIVGIRLFPRIDFTDATEPHHDVALVIEGEKIYVGKQILAFHSPVFNAMFYGNHIEKNMKEIELKEVNREVFMEMLNLIYPSHQKITDDNVVSLLNMADYFEINTVLEQAEQYLIDSTRWEILAKLKLSDEYRLVNLQDHCMDTFKTVKDVLNLQTSDLYKCLSDKAKAALLEKSMNLNRLED